MLPIIADSLGKKYPQRKSTQLAARLLRNFPLFSNSTWFKSKKYTLLNSSLELERLTLPKFLLKSILSRRHSFGEQKNGGLDLLKTAADHCKGSFNCCKETKVISNHSRLIKFFTDLLFHIFQQIVYTNPAKTGCRKGKFLFCGCFFYTVRIDNQKNQKTHDKAEKQNSYRLNVYQQNFCWNKDDSPNQDGQ